MSDIDFSDKPDLDTRIKMMTTLVNDTKISNASVGKNWALIREYISKNISINLKQNMCNWNILEDDQKKKFISNLVNFFGGCVDDDFKIDKAGFDSSKSTEEGYIAKTVDKKITFFQEFMETSEIETVVGYVAHEIMHVFQNNGLKISVLNSDLVKKCNKYYVDCPENTYLYENNPIEREANIVEKYVKEYIKSNLKQYKKDLDKEQYNQTMEFEQNDRPKNKSKDRICSEEYSDDEYWEERNSKKMKFKEGKKKIKTSELKEMSYGEKTGRNY